MRYRKIELVCLMMAASAFLQIAGCTSSEQFYEEATLSRETAYKQWKLRKEREEKSQTLVEGKLTLEDSIKLALVNNKTLQSVTEVKEIARGIEVGSYSAILPSVGLTGQYKRVDAPQTFNFNGQTVTLGALDNYSGALHVIQPVFAGGAITARINSGKLQRLLADQTVRGAAQEVIYQAAHGYYDVLLDQQLYDISEEAVNLAKAQVNDVKQKRAGGVASDYDLLRAQVELSNNEAQLIQNKNAILVAKANLLKIMGVSQDSNFMPADELTYVELNMQMEQAVAVAYKNRPDLFSRQFNIKLQKENLRIAQSQYWPTVSGFYDLMGTKPDPHDPMINNWGQAWDFGVMANYPIFDGLAREGNMIQQRARLKQTQIDLVDTEETALLELTKSLFSIQNATEFVDSQQLNLERAKEGLRLAQVGYREGTNTELETIDAHASLTRARALYYQAIYSHLIAKLELHRAMGILMTAEAVVKENFGDAAAVKGSDKSEEKLAD
jgi:outer membrane protein